MFGHDLKMSCAKYQENRFRIDGEIGVKHALEIIVSLTKYIYAIIMQTTLSIDESTSYLAQAHALTQMMVI